MSHVDPVGSLIQKENPLTRFDSEMAWPRSKGRFVLVWSSIFLTVSAGRVGARKPTLI